MSSTLAIILIVAAMMASACLGVIFTSAICQARRKDDEWSSAKRQQDLLDEITRYKEQEEALRSELSRVSKLCPEIPEQNDPVG